MRVKLGAALPLKAGMCDPRSRVPDPSDRSRQSYPKPIGRPASRRPQKCRISHLVSQILTLGSCHVRSPLQRPKTCADREKSERTGVPAAAIVLRRQKPC